MTLDYPYRRGLNFSTFLAMTTHLFLPLIDVTIKRIVKIYSSIIRYKMERVEVDPEKSIVETLQSASLLTINISPTTIIILFTLCLYLVPLTDRNFGFAYG